MSSNFNDTTPAAPAGHINVKFQTDGAGNVSAYVPDVGGSLATIDLTAQTANISATTLYAVPSGAFGLYEVESFVIVTQAAGTTSFMPGVNVVFTDNDNNTSQFLRISASDNGNTLTTFGQGVVVINVKDSTTIQYSTLSYASSGSPVMQYALHIRIHKVA